MPLDREKGAGEKHTVSTPMDKNACSAYSEKRGFFKTSLPKVTRFALVNNQPYQKGGVLRFTTIPCGRWII